MSLRGGSFAGSGKALGSLDPAGGALVSESGVGLGLGVAGGGTGRVADGASGMSWFCWAGDAPASKDRSTDSSKLTDLLAISTDPLIKPRD